MENYHILNGDALKEQFPSSIPGEVIVARECLVDGPVDGGTPGDFFQTRAQFIAGAYSGFSTADYYSKTVSEFEKIVDIPADAKVYLWFEDDLFCQVNCWFVAHLLNSGGKCHRVSLVRPLPYTPFSFGNMSQQEMIQAFGQCQPIDPIDRIAALWGHYQHGDTEKLRATALSLQARFPFILTAVDAHIARIPAEHSEGRPVQALREIIAALGTKEFAPIFKAFSQKEGIYGFGDLQVRRLLDSL